MNSNKHDFSHRSAHRRFTRAALLLLTLVMCTAFALPASAASAASVSSSVKVTVNGAEIVKGKARIVDSTTYVPFRAFASDTLKSSRVTWSASTRTATLQTGDTTVTASVGKYYLMKNGTKIASAAPNRLIGGTLYVPVRPIANALGYSVAWKHSTYTVALTSKSASGNTAGGTSSGSSSSGSTSSSPSYTESDLYWLSRIIHAEAGGESYRGKLAVGTVVMNRVKSSQYPNTIYGVIFDKRYGIQFTPAYNGMIYKTPSAESVAAAKEVLRGYRISGNIQYFLNPSLASSAWFDRNLTYVLRIGNHVFYAPKK